MNYTYADYLLKPAAFSTVRSRKDVNTSQKFLDMRLEVPFLSAPMDTITESNMTQALSEVGALGVLHRFWSVEDNIKAFKSNKNSVASIGSSVEEFERATALIAEGCNKILIDVAMGANTLVVEQVKRLKSYSRNLYIIVGNFSHKEQIEAFNYHLGSKVSAYRVNIGGGSVCETRVKTGIGVPVLQSLLDCNNLDLPLVADGGFQNYGDVAKALSLKNVQVIMTGRFFAGTKETPGVIEHDYNAPFPTHATRDFEEYYSIGVAPPGNGSITYTSAYKSYRGSASEESYKAQGKTASWRAPEGISTRVIYKGSVKPIVETMKSSLTSSMTYCNAKNLTEFKENAKLELVSNNTNIENGAHAK